jgi:FKBP-type peptidyl-prolyl cis-trans isomerase FkpA
LRSKYEGHHLIWHDVGGCDNKLFPTPFFRRFFVSFVSSIFAPGTRAIIVAAALLATTASQAQNTVTAAAAKEEGAVVTASGLVYRSLKDGTGASPTASDKVKVHYRGTFPDGKEFDSSYKRNEAIEFPLSGVIKCWTEGVQRMKVGGKAKLTCPAAIAYGERGAGGVIPPNATLLFEVELLAINGK